MTGVSQDATEPPPTAADSEQDAASNGTPATAADQAANAEPITKEAPREVVVMLEGGREVVGILASETDDAIVLQIEGIETTFRKADVRQVRYLPSLLDRYAKMRSLVAADDLDGRVMLAEWLRSREQYDLALVEIDSVLSKDAMHPRAKQLRSWLEQQVALERQRMVPQASSPTDQSSKDRFAARNEAKSKFPLLTNADINVIRVYEVDLKYPPRMKIARSTVDRLIREYAESPLIPATIEGRESLYRMPTDEILKLMFRLQARDLYTEVEVLEHPRAIRLFRSEVHGRWLLNSCASAQCHGGQEAGKLWLYTDKPNADQTVYTNMLILDRFKLADGTPLVNYAQPAKSPLLQMGLPQELSLYPHPEVPRTRGSRGWKPVFKTTQDRRYQEALDWISSMYRPRPDYPIKYTPPVSKPATADPEPDR